MIADAELPPLAALLSAHAGARVAQHRAIWAFDARLAKVARTTSEAAIGQMRLAWWNDVVEDAQGVRGQGIKGQGEPVVDAMRAAGVMAGPGLVAMIDGWEVLVVEPEIDAAGLRDYAVGRGGGLFRALAGVTDVPEWLVTAGQVWAYWDLAGHVGDEALANAAIAQACDLLPQVEAARWAAAWKPLRIAFTLARQDVLAGRGAPLGISRALAWRLLRIALVGR
jgi:phytoene synthase